MCCARIWLVEPDPVTGEERDAARSDNLDIVDIRQHLVVAYHRDDRVPVWRGRNRRGYDGKARRAIYDHRPRICRDFPQSNPGKLSNRCCYHFAPKSRVFATITPGAQPRG